VCSIEIAIYPKTKTIIKKKFHDIKISVLKNYKRIFSNICLGSLDFVCIKAYLKLAARAFKKN
jgi:hypothetical protein